MDATENSLTDTGFDELVWLYVGCFPFGGQHFIYRLYQYPTIHRHEHQRLSSLTFDQSLLVKAVEIVRAKDVSHPDDCSRWLIFHLIWGSGVHEAL